MNGIRACSGRPFWQMNVHGSSAGCAVNSTAMCDESSRIALNKPTIMPWLIYHDRTGESWLEVAARHPIRN
ncbi:MULTISPECIES: hypothetical protein [unclassified Novosphingobium]|uniref:hypothetical protein n=1 Tax=unclassified Novosphingobium TaxID=2644732 RepID=UPI0002FD4596|nr:MULTISPECIES: hypothetical protein [unclassified Novosphingobium]